MSGIAIHLLFAIDSHLQATKSNSIPIKKDRWCHWVFEKKKYECVCGVCVEVWVFGNYMMSSEILVTTKQDNQNTFIVVSKFKFL